MTEPYQPPSTCVVLRLQLGASYRHKDFFIGVTGMQALPIGAITTAASLPSLQDNAVHVCTVQIAEDECAVFLSSIMSRQELLAEATKLQQSVAPHFRHYVPEHAPEAKQSDLDDTSYS